MRTESPLRQPALMTSQPAVSAEVAGLGASRLVAFGLEIDCGDLFTLSRSASSFPQIGWVDVVAKQTWIGLGMADEILAYTPADAAMAPDACRDRLRAMTTLGDSAPPLRYFGGLAFDPTSPPHPFWKAGLPARFVLPEVTLCQAFGESRATATVVVALEAGDSLEVGQAALEAILDRFSGWKQKALVLAPPQFVAKRLQAPFNRERWSEAIQSALAETDSLEKIVLSREIWLASDTPIDPWGVLARFDRTGRGHRFCFRFDERSAFVGATPERLVAIDHDQLQADCLAGTTGRGRDEDEDDQLATSLLANDKERREHAFVVDAVTKALSPFCSDYECPEVPGVLRLPTVQHLHTPFVGRLIGSPSLGAILTALHPTPAVCGEPRDYARETIRRLELQPRGWYAGAIGWIETEAAEFAVGIRSAILHPAGAIAISGAGIVAGSDPDAEYEETERKASGLLSILEGRTP